MLTTAVSRVLDKLPSAKRTPNGWMARCPAHKDSTPSLSIAAGDNGGAVLNCLANCTTESVVQAIGLGMADLFPPKETRTKKHVVAEYPYHDEQGTHLSTKVRYAPKGFSQRRADGQWSMKGVRRVVYQLPQLRGHDEVFVVEGERDVDNLWKLGLPATCNGEGAGKWTTEHATQLVTMGVKSVSVIPDNDTAGRLHAQDVARSCTAAGIEARILALPGLPEKGDVSDWLAAGGTKAELTQMATAAPNWTTSTAVSNVMVVPIASDEEQEFTRNEKGKIDKDSLDNIRLALVKMDVKPSFDEFSREVRLNGDRLDDSAVNRLWVGINDMFEFRPTPDTLYRLIEAEAYKNKVHPVRDYLASLSWDGRCRLGSWLTTYAGANGSRYVGAVGSLVLMAAVRRIRKPGCKFDELAILEGAQGTGKSSAIRILCGNDAWFSDDLPLGVDSKQVIERTSGRWIVEAAELHGNRGKEAEQMKAFLSRQSDGPVRLAYGRLPVTVDRQFMLIGTTNTSIAYLKDMTGSRRFWPVATGQFDLDGLARDRDQLWAEAAAREASGDDIRLDPALWGDAAEHQEDRRAADPWEEILEPLLEGDGIVTVEHVPVSAIWTELNLEGKHRDNRYADRIAAIVQRYGFTKKKPIRVDGGKPQLCWLKGGSE